LEGITNIKGSPPTSSDDHILNVKSEMHKLVEELALNNVRKSAIDIANDIYAAMTQKYSSKHKYNNNLYCIFVFKY
jgi:hypothetical protein